MKRSVALTFLVLSTVPFSTRPETANIIKAPLYFLLGHIVNFGGNQISKEMAKQIGFKGEIARRLFKINGKHFINAGGKYALAGVPEIAEMHQIVTTTEVPEFLESHRISNFDYDFGQDHFTTRLDATHTDVTWYEYTGERSKVFFVGWDTDNNHRVWLPFLAVDPKIFDRKTWQGLWYSAGVKMLTLYDVLEFMVHGTRHWQASRNGVKLGLDDIHPEYPLFEPVIYKTDNCSHVKGGHNRFDVHKMASRTFDVMTSIPQTVLHDLPKLMYEDPQTGLGVATHFIVAYAIQEGAFALSEPFAYVVTAGLGRISPPHFQSTSRFFKVAYPFNVIFFTTISYTTVAYMWPHACDTIHLALEPFGLYNHNAENVYHNAYGAGDKGPIGMTGLRAVGKSLATLPVLATIFANERRGYPAFIVLVLLPTLGYLWRDELASVLPSYDDTTQWMSGLLGYVNPNQDNAPQQIVMPTDTQTVEFTIHEPRTLTFGVGPAADKSEEVALESPEAIISREGLAAEPTTPAL